MARANFIAERVLQAVAGEVACELTRLAHGRSVGAEFACGRHNLGGEAFALVLSQTRCNGVTGDFRTRPALALGFYGQTDVQRVG